MNRVVAPATPPADPLGPVLLVGAGLVGTSIALALRSQGEVVHLADRVRAHAMTAAALGGGVLDTPEPAAVRLVVVATPPDSVVSVVRQALADFPQAVVTDVASVKGAIVDELGGSLPQEALARYVGSHPMAGSQHAGPLTANAHLFVDRTWVVTSTPANRPEDVARVRLLAQRCGARVVDLPAQDHDRAVARVSHVPQIMSSLTAANLTGAPDHHLALAGQGIRDVTRIAASDAVLWRQIIGANRDAVREELEHIRRQLDQLLAGLDQPEVVQELIERGRRGQRRLPGKHGAAAREWGAVVVEIPDAPGALARLFGDVDALGFNVEDLAIEHDQTRQVGFLSVAVAPEGAESLATQMRERGWTVRG